MPAVFEPASFLTGDWIAASFDTTVTWMRPGRPDGAIYGVALSDPPAVWVIDDEPADVPIDQRWLRLTVYEPNAATARPCDQDRDQPEGLWFECTDDAGGTIRFVQNGEMLDYEFATDTAGPFTFHHSPTDAPAAPGAEDADRMFDGDVLAHGVAGWTPWFAEDAVMWDELTAVRGHDGITALMTPVLDGVTLRWQPKVSKLSGNLATTTGVWQMDELTGTYVTVWRQDADGWHAIFDVGRSDKD